MKKLVPALILFLLAGLILVAGCAQSQAPTPAPTTAAPTQVTPTPVPDTIGVTTNPQYGPILTDANGKTLYYFTKDTPGSGTSVCTLGCPGAWPPFNAADIRVSPPLQASDFGTITRADGTKQTTWKGWPLYYYAADTAAGDTKGYGINGFWYMIAPTGVVTLSPTTTIATTRPTTVPTTYYSSGGGY
jgi:predicted lipoprotein with Yx(FWY)xxD motif